MIFDLALYIAAFTTLFVVIDPIGLAPIFVALTQGMSRQKRQAVALRACGVAVGILCLFGLFGENILTFLGISLPAFRIAGGILLFLTALEMLFEFRTKRRQDRSDEPEDDPSVFPLAIPLIAGPGAIATMILLAGQTNGTWTDTATAFAAMFSVISIVFAFFMAAGFIERALGKTGILVVTRLLGMLLAALSAQFVVDGIMGLGQSL